jgi:D-3-phosphoglycerate dehydrogenase / 2-oxoglutarate reductase
MPLFLLLIQFLWLLLFANANYISMNIPYILKGKGSTHGIIGKEVLNHCKPGAIIINFAHGEELVDSEASYERHFR